MSPVERLVNPRQIQSVDPIFFERQPEDLRPAADEGLGVAGLDGDRQRLADSARLEYFRRQSGAARDDHRDASRERRVQCFPGSPAENQVVPERQLLETPEVCREAPWQATIAPEETVLGDSGDE